MLLNQRRDTYPICVNLRIMSLELHTNVTSPFTLPWKGGCSGSQVLADRRASTAHGGLHSNTSLLRSDGLAQAVHAVRGRLPSVSEGDLTRLQQILALKFLGFSLT